MDIIVKTPSNEELNQIDFSKWGTWECGVSVFPWTYDTKETCYILDGHVVVDTDTQKVEFKKGDLVVFPKGLNCKWNVLKPVRKYYIFD
jgi:uncharacterized cupin superfamily protein